MERLLELLKKNARESNAVLAKMLNRTEAEICEQIAELQQKGIIRGFQAVLNHNRLDDNKVRAVIEMRIRPERDGGFDLLAQRISKFPQVESMFLMSGSFDLLLFIQGESLQEVANFVSARLAPLDGVLSTSTHFMLKTYKDQGVLMEGETHDKRLPVTP